MLAVVRAANMAALIHRNDEVEVYASFGPFDANNPGYCQEWLTLEVRRRRGVVNATINWKSSSITFGREEATKLARMLDTVVIIESLVRTVIVA